jgi:hypothetical protein
VEPTAAAPLESAAAAASVVAATAPLEAAVPAAVAAAVVTLVAPAEAGSSGGGGGGIIDGHSRIAQEEEWSYANDVGDDDVHESDDESSFSIDESDDVNLLKRSAEKEIDTWK